jgi:hypothetical protein
MINMKMLLCITIFLVHLYKCLICIQVDFLNASRWQMFNSYKISLKYMKVRLWLHFWYVQSDRVLKCTIVLSTFVYYIYNLWKLSWKSRTSKHNAYQWVSIVLVTYFYNSKNQIDYYILHLTKSIWKLYCFFNWMYMDFK